MRGQVRGTMVSSYLLIDEVFVVVFDVEFPLHILNLGALQEHLPFYGKHLFPCQLALPHKSNQLPGILELLPEPSQFVGTLRISTASLANLADFTPTEADIWISVVGVLAGLELHKSVSFHLLKRSCTRVAHLEARRQWLVPGTGSPRLPVLIDALGEMLYTLFYGCVHGILDFREGKNWRTIYSRIRLLRVGCFFEEMHDLLELILGAVVGTTEFLVHDLEIHIILLGHVIRTSAAILDSRGEADVRRRLREDRGIERVILDTTDDGLWRGDIGLVYFSLGRGANCGLQVKFLSKNRVRRCHLGGLTAEFEIFTAAGRRDDIT